MFVSVVDSRVNEEVLGDPLSDADSAGSVPGLALNVGRPNAATAPAAAMPSMNLRRPRLIVFLCRLAARLFPDIIQSLVRVTYPFEVSLG